MSAPTWHDSTWDHEAEQLVELPTGMTICHRVDGPADGDPVVLVAGMSEDMTAWTPAFVGRLLERGHRVVRLDNRDIGRSSRVPSPAPPLWRLAAARPLPGAYSLHDMADDTVALLDHLGLGQVHLVGRSMGGMIAQIVAAREPDRVASLTSIYSTTGARRVGATALSTKRHMMRPPARTEEEWVRQHLAVTRHLSGTAHPVDVDEEVAHARLAWARLERPSPGGVLRQVQAIAASGNRSRELARIVAPTLVVHGDRDLIVHPSGGRATAEAIPGARHVEVPGMGHHLPASLALGVADDVLHHIESARSTRPRGDQP
ncbi:alpha/beta fold hydrolase [Nocardioides daphniae]|uniref:Alpha/beta fold hydrolase n=1 Tax=Nocardioides daphniae TaxID=402297 RepID=A0A4P7UDY4_9ACTN|nr:alpha/beta fold hydrolase [Nocardioides daphniae]QCC77558.1 alpha/beta fold hydrolase [Nocardioides daphniae]GGD30800.1 alpha/beta hydrolase [Nocardioides daphniae]